MASFLMDLFSGSYFFQAPTASQKPLAVTYIDQVDKWWPPEETLKGLGVPGYNYCMDGSTYNRINLGFWVLDEKADNKFGSATDLASIWEDPVKYLGTQSGLGTTKHEILQNLMKRYHDAGIKVLIAGFGATAPRTPEAWPDATETCTALAQFALDHFLDGVDIDYECNACMEAGTGAQWVIDCVKAVRALMPMEEGYILSHAPQAPYFYENKDKYPDGAYLTVNEEVGDLSDYYNIQFYNQGTNGYNTCYTLFNESRIPFTRTAVDEIADKGVDMSKIVIGKPAAIDDVVNTGYMLPEELKVCIKDYGFKTGFSTWQFYHDINCFFAKRVLEGF